MKTNEGINPQTRQHLDLLLGHGRRDRRPQAEVQGGFRTQKQAQSHLATVIVQVGEGTFVEPSKLTVGEYLNGEWLPAVAGTLRPLSVTKYAATIRLYVIPAIGAVRLQALSPGQLNALYAGLERDGLSVSTRRLVHAVSAALSGTLSVGDVFPATLHGWPTLPLVAAPVRVLGRQAELRRFLDHVADDRLYALWRLAATTGCAAVSSPA